ncbi:MAG: type II toxin-antitoxin system VapC family toxin [Clostridia bacterium]|nr:type II toxin-antitoxin system VapC family toxin [Clostridia bacterium]
MGYLLDTCALIDMLFNPERLSAKARNALEGSDLLMVSIASFWEIMIKQQIGKLGIKETSAQDLMAACTTLGIEVLQTEIKHIDLIRSLPRFKDHGDPFDRLIICQALSEKLPIITSDGKMSRYGVEVIW